MLRTLRYSIITSFSIFIVLLLIKCDTVTDPEPVKPDEQINAFTHVNLLRMTGEVIDTNQTVIIEGTKIIDFGPSDIVDIPEDLKVLDGGGAYLMPGLADMHMHTKEDWLGSDWPVDGIQENH